MNHSAPPHPEPNFTRRLRRSAQLTRHFAQLEQLVRSVGDPVWVAGPTAAALHGFDGFELAPPFHLVVPRGRFVNRVGHVLHTSRRFEPIDRTPLAGLYVSSPTRTLIDLAASTDPLTLTTALDSALRDGGTSDDFLHRRIVALRGRGREGTAALLGVVAGREVTRGGHSWLEREFLTRIAEAGLPLPLTQQVLARRGDRLVRVDCHFPGTRVVVELLGYRFHSSPNQARVDAERMNALMLAGYQPYQFTYIEVVEHIEAVVATVTAALRQARRAS